VTLPLGFRGLNCGVIGWSVDEDAGGFSGATHPLTFISPPEAGKSHKGERESFWGLSDSWETEMQGGSGGFKLENQDEHVLGEKGQQRRGLSFRR
jgi:hypothetical protein